MKYELYIGSHVGMHGPNYLIGSINEALSYSANALMLYTGPNQSTIRTSLDKLKIAEFQKMCKENNIELKNVVIHAPYILNLATNDIKKAKFYCDFLTQDLLRAEAIGAKYFVLHPGNAINIDRKLGLDNIVKNINSIYDNNPNLNVTICLESMAGKGNELGKNFDELSYMIKNIKCQDKIGICLDSCHLNDTGYDLTNWDKIFDEFDQKIGLKYLHVIHVNDSKNPIESHKDRHENIGYGTIGLDNLHKLIFHPKTNGIVKILETPWYQDKPFYKQEIEILKSNKFYDYRK